MAEDCVLTSKVVGECEDTLFYLDDKGNIIETKTVDQGHNVICNDARRLFAGLLGHIQLEVKDEPITLTGQNIWYNLAYKLISSGVSVTSVDKLTTYVRYTDYDIDDAEGRIISRVIPVGTNVLVNYKHFQNLYLALGGGDPAWDLLLDPSSEEEASYTKLVNEVIRKPIPVTAFSFVDMGNNIVTTPTNRIQLTMVIEEEEAKTILREYAIMGFDANQTKDSGLILNFKIHSKIDKTNDKIKIERKIRITFV